MKCGGVGGTLEPQRQGQTPSVSRPQAPVCTCPQARQEQRAQRLPDPCTCAHKPPSSLGRGRPEDQGERLRGAGARPVPDGAPSGRVRASSTASLPLPVSRRLGHLASRALRYIFSPTQQLLKEAKHSEDKEIDARWCPLSASCCSDSFNHSYPLSLDYH